MRSLGGFLFGQLMGVESVRLSGGDGLFGDGYSRGVRSGGGTKNLPRLDGGGERKIFFRGGMPCGLGSPARLQHFLLGPGRFPYPGGSFAHGRLEHLAGGECGLLVDLDLHPFGGCRL